MYFDSDLCTIILCLQLVLGQLNLTNTGNVVMWILGHIGIWIL